MADMMPGDVEQYVDFEVYRASSPGDHATADWMRDGLDAAGFRTRSIKLPGKCSAVEVEQAFGETRAFLAESYRCRFGVFAGYDPHLTPTDTAKSTGPEQLAGSLQSVSGQSSPLPRPIHLARPEPGSRFQATSRNP